MVIIVALLAVGFIVHSANADTGCSKDVVKSSQIPSWVKNDAGWWADSSIGDGEFVSAIQYLVGLGIINTNLQTNTQSSSDSSTSVSASSSNGACCSTMCFCYYAC